MAGALAQRMRKAGHLGAAYFCRHNDGTRNDPRHLLGTIACQLCYCNFKYNYLVGGEDCVRMMLANSKLGVQELFTKLLEEPLGKSTPCQQRKLVIIDALDETEYESREDFLDLVKERFPRLPKWLVFFITSRPEHTVESRLEKYNPCVRICAGSSKQGSFYKHHEHDIQRFLEKRVDFSRLPYSVKDITKKCNGLFLYAFYIVKVLNNPAHSGTIDELSDHFPGNIEDFFRKNFKRLYDKVGKDIFKKLFGCAIAAPTPLPVAIIGYILEREKSSQDEQEVIDVVSQFVVLRSSDRSLTFLHNLIPAWLTNKGKAGKLFIDKTFAGQYLSKIFTEILSVAGNAPLQPLPTLDQLEDYVLRVAVRFLCRHGDKDSLKLVSSCLTSFQFLERKVRSGKIEIYHLLEDLKLAAGCYGLEDTHKQKILQEISLALEGNFPILLECPHLLRSCLLNSSSVVREHVLMPQVSGPRLEWIVYDIPSIEDLSDFKYFATSFDKTTAALVKENSILLVDVSTLKAVGGPFEISQDTIEEITSLEFSPDDKWLFFGRLDKWFSVERGCIDDFRQFSGNSLVYKSGLFTPDGQYIVVKRDKVFDFQQTCQNIFCVFDFLSLWALLEIDQEGVGKLTCCFAELSKLMAVDLWQVGGQTERLLKFLGMDPSWRQTGVTPVPYDSSCYCCSKLRELTESNQDSSLSAVRQFISDLYPRIFYYQVWNFQTGRSLLEDAFCQGGQLNPFTYVCHLTSAFTKLRGRMWCSGIKKAVSIANIATVNAIYALECELLSKEVYLQANHSFDELELRSEERLEGMWDQMRELELKQEWVWKEQQELQWQRQMEQEVKVKQLSGGELKWISQQMWELKHEQWWVCKWMQELERHRKQMWVPGVAWPFLQKLEMLLEQEQLEQLQELLEQQGKLQRELERKLEWQLELEKKQMRERVWEWQRELERKQTWELKEKRELDLELQRQLEWQRQQQRLHQRQRLSELQQELKGNRSWYFDRQLVWKLTWWELEQKQMQERELEWEWERVRKGTREFCNLFSRKTKQKALFFSNFPQRSSVVAKSIATAFTSSDTVMSVRSNSIVALWSQRMDEEKGLSFKFISEFSLSGSFLELSNIENWAFSPDGKRAACRQGNKIQLYSTVHSIKTLCTLLEGDFLDTDLVCLTFSADNIVLLICIQDGMNEPRFYEWDVKRKVMSSFKSPLLTVECCCLSSDKKKFILCGECEIKIWEYNKGSIHLLARGGIAQKSSVRFSYCAVSLDNELLVCCIANIIIVFHLCAPEFFSSKQILKGHIGRIVFCKFLRVNRYLISCGVDGMVFLWDLIEAKAVGFTRIAQGQENIVSMAVSPEEERVVCFTSSACVYLIRLWNLESALSSNLVRESMKGKAYVTDTSLQLAGEISSKPKPISSVDGYKITDFSIYEDDERFTLTVEDFVSSGDESD